jgi:hypothetical protein
VTVGVTVVLVEPEALIPVVLAVLAAILEQAAPEQMDTILMQQVVLVVVVPVVAEQQGNLAAVAAELASMDKELAVALDLHNKAGALEDQVVIMDSLRVVVVAAVAMVVAMAVVVAVPQTALD